MITTKIKEMNIADVITDNMNNQYAACEADGSEVFFDIEMVTSDLYNEDTLLKDGVPTFRDAFEFLLFEAKAFVKEYATPFNILMAKVALIVLIIVISIGSVVSGLVNAHIAKEQKRQAEIEAQLAAEEAAKREEKRQTVIAGKEEVLGKWYEMDPEREDIRTLFIEVDDDAKCVYTIGDETGEFTYNDGKLSLLDPSGGQEQTLVLSDDKLNDEVGGISYYKTNASINSLKFAEFLKNNLPGTYQEFMGDYLLIYPDGKWQIDSPWGFDEAGTWSMEINEGSVLLIFEGMGIHYGGGNIYKVTEDEYEAEKAEISSGDFSLRLDVNSYDRISSKLP